MPFLANGSILVLLTLTLILSTLMSMDTASSYNLLPPPLQKTRSPQNSCSTKTPSTTTTRRETLHRFIADFSRVPLVGSAAALAILAPPTLAARAADDDDKIDDSQRKQQQQVTETDEQRNARLLKDKIAASKKKIRKADSYAKVERTKSYQEGHLDARDTKVWGAAAGAEADAVFITMGL